MRIDDIAARKTAKAVAVAAFLSVIGGACVCSAQDARAKELPLVWVLSTGGTIAGKGASATDLSNYKSGALLGEDLVNAVPAIRQFANVKVEQVVNVASQDMTLDTWITLGNRINRIFAEDAKVAGIVITHGTSTLERRRIF
jgi:L-asparaginase